jgi:ubiquinone biosynthesis protein
LLMPIPFRILTHRATSRLDRTLFRLDLISDRIASAIVLAFLVIGSSIIVLSQTPPKWHEIPIISLAAILLADVMGFWLLTSMLKSGKGKKND